jgi:O-antigen/teichoic acid export membrane protein
MKLLRTAFGSVLRSPTIRNTAVLGSAGVGFSLANLLLARGLPREEYAIFALVITFFNVAIPLAPMGVDVLLNRRELERGRRLFLRTLSTSLIVAALAVTLAGGAYGVTSGMLWLIGLAVTVGGINYVAGAHFQSRRRFGLSLLLHQGMNFVMILAAGATLLLGWADAAPAVAIMAASYVVLALIGWTIMLAEQRHEHGIRDAFSWAEALSCLGVGGVAIVLGQLERLLIPQFLTLEVLATYGILAAIVGSAYRMLWIGVGFTLIPGLRAADSPAARRRLLRQEATTVGGIMALAGVVIWVVTPPLVEWLLVGKYYLSGPLILAAIVNGVLKVGSAFSRAAVTALGTARGMTLLNRLGFVAMAAAVVGAAIGARWGLPGLLYGVAAGWLVQGIAAAVLAVPHLRDASPPGQAEVVGQDVPVGSDS